jgi:hypothetical protein
MNTAGHNAQSDVRYVKQLPFSAYYPLNNTSVYKIIYQCGRS